MLFHVAIAVRVPHDIDPEKVKKLGEREHGRAAELQQQGKWLHLWRVAGKWANVSVFKVESAAELHEILGLASSAGAPVGEYTRHLLAHLPSQRENRRC
jgi:muconolactone D-isomerase